MSRESRAHRSGRGAFMNFHLVLFFYSELQLYNIKKAFAGSFKGSAELLNQTSFDGDC